MGFEVTICSIAIFRAIGGNPIRSLTDQSREAIACNTLYPSIREMLLAEYDFPFARRTEVLELTAETSAKWTYVYKRPANCLTARNIYNPTDNYTTLNREMLDSIQPATKNKIPFEEGIGSDGNHLIISTNQPTASLVYTAKVLNDALFPPKIVDALSWRMAAELALPLGGSKEWAGECAKRAVAALSSAGARAANEEYESPNSSNDLADARL